MTVLSKEQFVRYTAGGAARVGTDQATVLRSLVREKGRTTTASAGAVGGATRASVIAITSGKGGVGKSNVAVNLAIRFAAAGKRAVLLDADMGLANADVLCNLELPANLSHVIGRQKELREVMFKGPGGFHLIGGASGLARMADLSELDRRRLVDALSEIEHLADVIIIDTGAGISQNVLTFTRAADHVLVVTTPEPTAITDAYAVIKVISREGAGGGQQHQSNKQRVSLLVNQARNAGEARAVFERVAKVSKQFLNIGIFDAGSVPADEQVQVAVRRRVPFLIAAPKSAASVAVGQLAMRLEQGVPGPASDGGFFHRMGRWFRK